MKSLSGRNAIAVALILTTAAACETGTDPGVERTFDAEAALQDHQALDSILVSDAMNAFRTLSQGVTFQSFEEGVRLAGRIASELGLATDSESPAAMGARIGRILAQAPAGPAQNPIISSFRRGKTFIYDPARKRYVIDQGRDGAPETGVRFILYEPAPEGPDPEKEIGYADLIDEGDDSAEEIVLRLVVVEGSDTILGYRTTVDVLEDGGAVTVDGFLQGRHDRLDFDIRVRGSAEDGGGSIDITFEMGITQRDFLITGAVHGANGASGEGGHVVLSVAHGSDSFVVDVQGDDDTVDATFHLNDELFATARGDAENPVIAGPSGGDLTWPEILVLRQILDAVEDVFDLFEDLLDPVDELVILGLVL